jgi:anti-sigma factor ChrR (cupin superfamily)
MRCTELQELAAAYAAGALSRADAARLDAMAAQDPELRDELAALHDATTAAVAGSLTRLRSPSGSVRTRILDQIQQTAQSSPASPPASGSPGHFFIPESSNPWTSTGVPGFRVKILSVQPQLGYRLLLLELDAGGRIPAHDHAGSEEILLLSGDLVTEGRTLGAGDFVHFDPQTHHHELTSPNGCRAVMVEHTPHAARTIQTTPTPG